LRKETKQQEISNREFAQVFERLSSLLHPFTPILGARNPQTALLRALIGICHSPLQIKQKRDYVLAGKISLKVETVTRGAESARTVAEGK